MWSKDDRNVKIKTHREKFTSETHGIKNNSFVELNMMMIAI